MDIRQLRYFTVLAEEGQVSKAAKILNMSQPPLSQQLHLMEEELGVTLLERKKNGKSMKLTEAGKVFYEKSKTILNVFEDSLLEVKETAEGIKGNLLIGSVLAYVSFLPEKLKRFQELNPDVSVKLLAGDPNVINNYLEHEEIELAIVYLPVDLKGLAIKELGKVPNVLIVPKAWEHFNSRDSITLKEIANHPLLMLHRIKGLGIYDEIMEEFEEKGINPRVLCECPDVNVLISLVSAGMGASIVPKSAVTMQQGITVLDISDSDVYSNIALVWKEDRYLSKATQHFLELF